MEYEIKSEAMLTSEGCVEMLESLRGWLRCNVTVASLESLEKSTDEVIESRASELSQTWKKHRQDPVFLMGIVYGVTLFQQSINNLDSPFGMVREDQVEKIMTGLLMMAAKQGIRVHDEKK